MPKKMDKLSNERRIGVLIEHFDSKLDLVVEQFGDIKETLNDHTQKLDSHTEMIGRLAVDMEIVKGTLNDHTAILNDHTEKHKSHTENIEIIKTDIEFIKNGLKKKVDVDEFAALERRVALLESHR